MSITKIEGEGDNVSAFSLLTHKGPLTDQDILEAFCSLGECESDSVPAIEAINALVARHVLIAGLKDGCKIVLPISALVQRTMRVENGCFRPIGTADDGSLFALRRRLEGTSADFYDRMETALMLGDRATHFAAGAGGGYLKRNMENGEASRYCERMALGGYHTALDIAEARKMASGRRIIATVPTLLERFEDIILIIRELIRNTISASVPQIVLER